MIDPDAFAALLCDWCLDVQPGHQVLIASTTETGLQWARKGAAWECGCSI